MRSTLRFVLGIAVAVAFLATGVATASEKLATETGKSCTTCHDKPGSKRLTDMGKYFETTRSFDGYASIQEKFGRCTSCHSRKPGSHSLTKKGKEFAELAKDMKGLNQWMKEGHPSPAAK